MVDFSNFRSWVASQPPEQRYFYNDPGFCALGQFLRHEHPGERVLVNPDSVMVGSQLHDLPLELDNAVSGRSRRSPQLTKRRQMLTQNVKRQTFGQLARRLAAMEDA